MKARNLIVLLFVVLSFPPLGIAEKLLPVDEAGQDSSFSRFRNKLIEAVDKKNVDYVFSCLLKDQPVYTEVLYRKWGAREYAENYMSRKWDILAKALSLGGKFTHPDTFVVPYITAAWPEDYNEFTHVATIKDSVPVYESWDTTSNVIAHLSHDIVEIDTFLPEHRWYNYYRNGVTRIRLADGNRGFVSINDVRSPLAQRIKFVRIKDEWKILTVVDNYKPPAPVIDFIPVDEAAEDSSFLKFRNKLMRAVEGKDTTFIFNCLHPDIRFSFGDGVPGRNGFKQFWNLGQSVDKSELWETMQQVLTMGGAFQGDSVFQAPYISSNWPACRGPIRPDSYEYSAIIEQNVPVYSDTSYSSPVIDNLDYCLVLKDNEYWKYGDWAKIFLMDGRPGFIRKCKMYSPIGYRAYFLKQGSRWLMRYFIAGD